MNLYCSDIAHDGQASLYILVKFKIFQQYHTWNSSACKSTLNKSKTAQITKAVVLTLTCFTPKNTEVYQVEISLSFDQEIIGVQLANLWGLSSKVVDFIETSACINKSGWFLPWMKITNYISVALAWIAVYEHRRLISWEFAHRHTAGKIRPALTVEISLLLLAGNEGAEKAIIVSLSHTHKTQTHTVYTDG